VRSKSFIALSIFLMACARIADVAVTYQFSPDLAFEGNPMVRSFGMGWTFLLTANILAVLAIAACSIYWLRHPLKYKKSSEVSFSP
jgi:hypothetical protein